MGKRLLRECSNIPEPGNVRPARREDGVRKIRPLALTDGFKPRGLRCKVKTAYAGKQAHVGQINFACHCLFLRRPQCRTAL